jgi:hypothetical protein
MGLYIRKEFGSFVVVHPAIPCSTNNEGMSREKMQERWRMRERERDNEKKRNNLMERQRVRRNMERKSEG